MKSVFAKINPIKNSSIKKMKKYILEFIKSITIFSIIMATCGCLGEPEPKTLMEKVIKNDKVTVGVRHDAKPFGFLNAKGEVEGFDIDLAKRITRELLGDEKKVEFVEVTSSNRILALTSGKVDMVIATMSVTPQRKNIVRFSKPYYVAGQALMVQKNSPVQGLTDLRNRKVIVVLGSTGERSIKQFAPDAIIQGYKTNVEAYQALKKGYGDALTTDDTLLAGFMMDDPTVKILSKRYTQEPYAIAFRQDEESQSFASNVNHILEHLIKTGEINKLKNKWVRF